MGMKQRGYQAKQRNSGLRSRRPVILASVEGSNKTEALYLRDFARDKGYTVRIASGRETDPLHLAQALIRDFAKYELDRSLGDKAFCLVDSDLKPEKDEQIAQADQLLQEHDFQLLVSSPCFEIWYLCHYRRSSKHYPSSSAVIDDLKALYPAYTKSCENMYARLNDALPAAIENAKYLDQTCTDAGYRPHTADFSPSTEMYKLAEELLRE